MLIGNVLEISTQRGVEELSVIEKRRESIVMSFKDNL